MSWPQYRDGGFEGSVSKFFGVKAIPHTFTIGSDGVLQGGLRVSSACLQSNARPQNNFDFRLTGGVAAATR
jgi:hypothetical protein